MKSPSLTIVFVSCRNDPKFSWLIDSLKVQSNGNYPHIEFIGLGANRTPVKPTVWQGQHRLTKEDNWAVSNARNTGICLCETDWISFLDDRCVLGPQWLEAVKDAMRGRYVVCGPYEKTHNLVVENGLAKSFTETDGKDNRLAYVDWHLRPTAHKNPWPALPEWTYGCSLALPLEWALAVNGFDETCDGLSFEDVIFGLQLSNRGYPILFDERMSVIQDRTPDQCGPVMVRRDRGVSPNDASHKQIEMLKGRDRALHYWTPDLDLMELRKSVLAGKDWPKLPQKEYLHWWDGQPLREM